MNTKQTIRHINGIEYILTRKSVKNVNLRLHKDGSVHVSANPRVPLYYIDNFVYGNRDFIAKAKENITKSKEKCLIPTDFCDKAEFYFLGRQTIIKAVSKGEVKLDNNIVYIPANNGEAVKKHLLKWLNAQAALIFKQYVQETYREFKQHYNIPYPEITVRAMKSRWGSCRPDKAKITLNLMLLAAPPECIKYVTVHEFAHLLHPNHSKDFWNVVARFVPDYKDRRNALKSYQTI